MSSLIAGSYEHTFELYSEEGKVYLFGSDDGSIIKNWMQAIAMVINPFICFYIFCCSRSFKLQTSALD